eukprot:TRINITY_DN3814_c0_g1_i1.p1 TRINITY_DN3814_c0_g1~~TRINITY_DN3814_c0_g1_i1.p1  ORF type:complete len:198 (+),score=38.82 TRINITY_DN3814_c0_g1_i1:58-651(+)
MKRIAALVACALVAVASGAPFAVVGYLPEWRYAGFDWAGACSRNTHIILFSIECGDGGSLAALDRLPAPGVLAEARASCGATHTRLLVGVGGFGRSGALPAVAVDATSRARFAGELVALCDRLGLDGVDMNWEYPSTAPEWRGLFELLRLLDKALHPAGRVLTMALYPGQEVALKQLGRNIHHNVDLFHVMAYDSAV